MTGGGGFLMFHLKRTIFFRVSFLLLWESFFMFGKLEMKLFLMRLLLMLEDVVRGLLMIAKFKLS